MVANASNIIYGQKEFTFGMLFFSIMDINVFSVLVFIDCPHPMLLPAFNTMVKYRL